MMVDQYYGISGGRRLRQDRVSQINAQTPYLSRTKAIKDEEAYRNKVLAMQSQQLAQENALARDKIESDKESSDRGMAIGLGQLGVETYTGRKKNEKLEELIAAYGGGGESAPGAVVPSASPSVSGAMEGFLDGDAKPSLTGKAWKGLTDVEGWKAGLGNWGSIGAGGLTGATVGAELGEKYIGGDTGRAIGGAGVGFGMGLLASGNLYTAATTAVLGGLGGIFSG